MKQHGLSRFKRIQIPPRYFGRTRYKYSIANDLLRLCASNTPRHHFRLAVSASKSCGNAVIRNRLKRFAKETLRQHQHILQPGIDYLLIFSPSRSKTLCKSMLYKNLRFIDIQEMILDLLPHLHKKVTQSNS
jgi:ribonuclease P protein component